MSRKTKGLIILLVIVCLGLVISACAKKTVVREEPSTQSSDRPIALSEPAKEKDTPETITKEATEAPIIKEEETKVVREEPAKKEPEIFVPQKPEALEGHVIKDIYFDYDKYDIRPGDAEILKENATLLMKSPAVTVQVEGHCDERGTDEYNLALGERRANSVKNYVVSLGIEASRVSTISYGEENPLSREHDEEAWAKNRRGHFVVLSK